MKLFPLIIALAGASIGASALAENSLEEVFVTASGVATPLRQIGSSVSRLTNKDIQLYGYQSFSDLLSTQMSVSATGSGGLGKVSSLRIRGEEGFRTLIMIDGVDVSDPTATQVGPQVQHLASTIDIERIEILRGPQGFVFGADAGGVINIITRRAMEGSSAGLLAEYGRYDTRKLNAFVANGSDDGDLFLSLSELDSDGFNARPAFPSDEDDGYNNLTLHGKLGWNFDSETDAKKRIQLVLRNVNAQTQFDSCGDFFSPSDDCLGNFDQSIGKLSIASESDDYRQELAFSRSWIKRQSRDEGETSFFTAGGNESLNYVGSLSPRESIVLVFGLDAEREFVEQEDVADLQRDQLGVFSELQTRIENLYLNIGARFDHNEDFGDHLSGRISLAYLQALQHAAFIKYRSSFGTGFRAPSLFELDYNNRNGFGRAATIELNEEQSRGFDLGIEYHHQDGAMLGIGYFDQVIRDQIEFDLVDFSGYLQEDGESTSEGVELAFEFPLLKTLGLLGNYTYNETTNSDGMQRARRPETTYNLGLKAQYLDEKVTTLLNYRVLQDRVDYAFDGSRSQLDDYALLDMSASYSVSASLRVFARVENLLDEKYSDLSGFNTAARAAYAGLQYQL